MAGDVYVSFGADTSDLEASMAVAKAQVAELSSEMRDLAEQFNATGASADSDLGQQMVALGGKLNDAKGHVTAIKEELKGVGKEGEGEEERLSLFERMKESAEALASPLVALQSHFAELTEIIAGAFAVEKIADWAAETTEAAEAVERDAAKLGVSMTQVQELQGFSKLTGGDYQELATIFERLQLGLAKAGNETAPVAAGLKALGVNAAELRSQNPSQQLETMSEAFARFADGPTKTAAAIAVFGKAGADLIPILDKGKEGIEELRATMQRAGGTLSDETIEAFVATREKINEFGLALSNLSQDAFGAINSAAGGLVEILAHLVEQIHESATQGGFFALALQAVGYAARQTAQFIGETIYVIEQLDVAGDTATKLLMEGFRSFGQVVADVFASLAASLPAFFTGLVTAGKAAVEAVERQFVDLGTVIGDTLKLDFAGAKAAFGAMGDDASAAANRIGGAFAGVFDFSKAGADAKAGMDRLAEIVDDGQKRIDATNKRAQDEYNSIWELNAKKAEGGEGATKSAVPAFNLGGAGKSGADDAGQIVRQTFLDQVQAAKDAAAETEETLKRQLDFHQITMKEWLAQSTQALDREQDAIQDAADKALASDTLKTAEKLRLARQEDVEISAVAKKLAQDQDAAAKDTLKSWQSAFNQINSAFDSQIDGLLRGTTSWAQAFKNVLASLVEDLTKFFVNWGLKEVEQTVQSAVLGQQRVAAHVAGNAAITASDAGAAAAGGLAWAGSALKSIAASAAEAFAGVFGWMAPILGPAAAGPAAAAQATVLSVGASVASADIGMWSVPSDMLTMVHHNELIMPAAESSAFRSLLSGAAGGAGQGGGPSVSVAPQMHVHVRSNDAAGTAQWARNNAGDLAKAMHEAARHGALLGMRRFSPA